jgi:hypothetical protein
VPRAAGRSAHCKPIERSNPLKRGSARISTKRGSTPRNATLGDPSRTAAPSSSKVSSLFPRAMLAMARSYTEMNRRAASRFRSWSILEASARFPASANAWFALMKRTRKSKDGSVVVWR